MLGAGRVESLSKGEFVGKGLEHEVRLMFGRDRVMKDYDPRTIDLDTGETFFKPTDSVFDYLTDLMLANHFFGDDLRLEGFYETATGCLHVVISQPFVEGRHPSWDELVKKMEAQGLVHEGQGAGTSRFWLDGGPAGLIRVTDVHEDNVILNEETNWAHVIDVHFSFPGREARVKAMEALGLW